MTFQRRPIYCQNCDEVYVGRKIDGTWTIFGAKQCRQCGATEFEAIRND